MSRSVATAHGGPKPQGALVLVEDPRDDGEDRVQELQRLMVDERVQREKEKALRNPLEDQLKETLEFIKTQCHHNQMVKEATSLDSIEEVVCRIAACESVCRDAQGRSPACHLRQQWDQLAPEPAGPTTSGSGAHLPSQSEQAAGEDSMAVDDGVLRRFPAPEHVQTMMCDREVEPRARRAPVHQAHNGVALAALSESVHHVQTLAPSGPQVRQGVAFATSTPSVNHIQPPAASAPSVRRTPQVVEEHMEMDEEAAVGTS